MIAFLPLFLLTTFLSNFSVIEDISFGGNLGHFSTLIMMQNSGGHRWLAPAVVKTKCEINVNNFPFDEHTCTLRFGSWTYDKARLDIVAATYHGSSLGKHCN